MNSKPLRLASLSLAAVTALAVAGCGSTDATPTDLGTGVVTPGVTSSASAPSSAPLESTTSPTAGSTPSSETSPSQTPSDGASAVPAPVRDTAAEIDAENQSGDGRSVRVQEVRLSRSNGFVAVYTAAGDRLLGSSEVARSTVDRTVTVNLDPRVTDTAGLLVVLHSDDGDGRFDAAQDPRVMGDNDDNELEVDRITYRVR